MTGQTKQGFLALILGMFLLAGCSNGASHASAAHTPIPGTPVPTSTTNPDGPPTPEPTAGLPCTGGIWGGIRQTAEPGIPLPPLTVVGAAQSFPSGGWNGLYISLCTGGNIDGIDSFTHDHMAAQGWVYGAPPGDCQCNGAFVWAKVGYARLVQFEQHPAQYNGQVRWGVSIFTH